MILNRSSLKSSSESLHSFCGDKRRTHIDDSIAWRWNWLKSFFLKITLNRTIWLITLKIKSFHFVLQAISMGELRVNSAFFQFIQWKNMFPSWFFAVYILLSKDYKLVYSRKPIVLSNTTNLPSKNNSISVESFNLNLLFMRTYLNKGTNILSKPVKSHPMPLFINRRHGCFGNISQHFT